MKLIVAVSKNNCIGLNNELPWHIPSELKYFKKVTTHSTVIVGSKTLKSIGRLLPNREMIVITRDSDAMVKWLHENNMLSVRLATNASDARNIATELNRPIIAIGGSSIYDLFLDQVNTIYLTRVDLDVAGDSFFPELDMDTWLLRKSTSVASTATTPSYVKEVYTRTPKYIKVEMY